MKDQALISVVLPVYNAEDFLHEAIESVLNQTYSNFECIILNDGSSDSSSSIIQSFQDNRIRYIENEENLGLIKTLNKGIKLAKGEFIARMDADDICHKTRFEEQIAFLSNHNDYVLCGSWANVINENNEKTGVLKKIDTNGLLKSNLLFTTPFIHPAMMIRKTVFNEFLYDLEALHCEDLQLWVRISQRENNKVYNLKKVLLDYRVHSNNISVLNNDFQLKKTEELLVPYIKEIVPDLTEEEVRWHFLSFRNSKEKLPKVELLKVRSYFYKLSSLNRIKKKLNKFDLDALILSRWFVLCVKQKSLFMCFRFKLRFSHPAIVLGCLRLLINK